MIDGQIDYSKFSREDLIDCIRHVDPRRFPLNHANASSELGKRQPPKRAAVPEAIPTAQVRTSTARRPMAVWIISAFYLIGFAVIMPVYIAVRRGWLPLPMTPAAQASIDKLNLVDDIFSVVTGVVTALAAISLLRLQSKAFHLFSTAFCCNVAMTVYAASRGVFNQGYFNIVFALLIQFSVCLYARSLMNRGMLR